MTHIHHTSKQDKQFLFEVQLNWLIKKTGVLSANDANGTLQVATPRQFGGEGKEWSPEHLFLGSVSSCFMTTYLFFAQKLGFAISHFECNAVGQVAIVDGKYQFTHINIYPEIYLADDGVKPMAILALQKTQKHCLISNSIRAEIIYHGEVLCKTKEEKGEIPIGDKTI